MAQLHVVAAIKNMHYCALATIDVMPGSSSGIQAGTCTCRILQQLGPCFMCGKHDDVHVFMKSYSLTLIFLGVKVIGRNFISFAVLPFGLSMDPLFATCMCLPNSSMECCKHVSKIHVLIVPSCK